jgi:hypothetical protein
MDDDNNLDFLSPGIRLTVLALNHAGHVTCDSGGGESFETDGEESFVSVVSTPDYLTREAKEIMDFLELNGIKIMDGEAEEGVKIQALYYPKDDVALIDIIGVHDSLLPEVIRFNRATPQGLQ